MAQFNSPDNTLMALLASSTEALRLDPHNDTLRSGIFGNQVKLTAGQLGIPTIQAANVVRSYTSAYAYSKGYDPKAVLDGLTSAQQTILNYDKNKPTLYGMDLVTANRVASYFAAGAGVTLALSIIAFAVALFMIGPEVAAAVVGAGGVVEALSAVTGVAVGTTGGGAIAIGTFLFLISQMLGHMSASIPMWTKQMVDNGTIAASLQITAIKNVAEVQAQLSGTKAPGPYSSAQFSSLFNGLAAAGFTQIKNPVDGSLAPFTEQTLAQLINYLYGTQIGIGAAATPSKITPLINPWLYKGGSNNPIPLSLYDQVSDDYAAPAPATSGSSSSSSSSSGSQSSPATPAPVSVPNLQIFMGVISGGTLGLPQEFISTPAQLIASTADLVNSAKVNLAAAVASLPGRFYYEIGIVSTIKTKSGLTQKGAPVSIITGYYKNGKPKTKTVFYKFAVMNLGVTDENGRTVKLAQINLGPVDVTAFSPTPTQLVGVQNTIQSSSFTTDITSITNVVSPTPPTTTSTTPANPTPPVVTPPTIPAQTTTTPQQGSIVPTSTPAAPAPAAAAVPVQYKANTGGAPLSIYGSGSLQAWILQTVPNGTILQAGTPTAPFTQGGGTWVMVIAPQDGTSRPVLQSQVTPIYAGQTTTTVKNAAAAAAQNLSDLYAAIGQTLPSLDVRANLFQTLGLGPSGTYVGSADQNNKLLGALKAIYA